MRPKPAIEPITARRIAIPADQAWISELIPRGASGVYLLLRATTPIYVGRSDVCLRSRLIAHGLLPLSSHVVWEPCPPSAAYELEAFWYHKLSGAPMFLNRIHPAAPSGTKAACPFCEPVDVVARRAPQRSKPVR